MTVEVERRRLAEQARQARRDLAELEQQVAAGEISQATAARLREAYVAELEAAERAAAALVDEPAVGEEPAPTRSRRRLAVGGAALAVAFAATVGTVGSFVQQRDDGPLQGVAAGEQLDPSQYSNETMEAVIATYADDPAVADQLPFMRFALAERYFTAGDYQKAFPHYQAIIEGEPPPELGSAALTRVAWIVWVGNDEVDLALSLLDRALELAPVNAEAAYVKGQVTWCGAGRPEDAVPLFEQVLEAEDIGAEVAEQVRADLAAAERGEAC